VKKTRGPARLWGILFVPLLAGCSTLLAPRPERTHFYILTADGSNTQAPAASSAVSHLQIELGPINFPDYLSRSDMVTRSADNRIELSSAERWAEPLDVSFKRVLTIDLSRALGGAPVTVFPSFGANPRFDYRVEATIDRFESDAQGVAQLVSRWQLVDSTGKVQRSGSSNISIPAKPGDMGSIAEALSQVEAQFATQLAQAISALSNGRAT
jgi:uncharacterized lipoprotein YmbA